MERMLMTIEEVQAELVEARKQVRHKAPLRTEVSFVLTSVCNQAAESASAHFAASAQHKEVRTPSRCAIFVDYLS